MRVVPETLPKEPDYTKLMALRSSALRTNGVKLQHIATCQKRLAGLCKICLSNQSLDGTQQDVALDFHWASHVMRFGGRDMGMWGRGGTLVNKASCKFC